MPSVRRTLSLLSFFAVSWAAVAFFFVFYARVCHPVHVSIDGPARRDTDSFEVYCVSPNDVVFRVNRNFSITGPRWTIDNYAKNVWVAASAESWASVRRVAVDCGNGFFEAPGAQRMVAATEMDRFRFAGARSGPGLVTNELLPGDFVSGMYSMHPELSGRAVCVNWPGARRILFLSALFTIFPSLLMLASWRIHSGASVGAMRVALYAALIFASYVFYQHMSLPARFTFTLPGGVKNLLFTIVPCLAAVLAFFAIDSKRPARLLAAAAIVAIAATAAYGQHSRFVRALDVCSDRMVANSLHVAASRGAFHAGGFMIVYDRDDLVYAPQYALQYKVLAIAAPSSPALFGPYVSLSMAAFSAALAAVMAIFASAAGREFGRGAGFAVLVLTAFSCWPGALSYNLYWAAFTLFAPFVFSFAYYPALSGKPFLYHFIVAAFVMVKSLCGYEYLTCITLSAAAAVFYHEYRRIECTAFLPPLIAAFKAYLAGVAGFFAAFALHVHQGVRHFGSIRAAFDEATASAAVRTVGDVYGREVSLAGDAAVFVKYLLQPVTLFMSTAGIVVACAVLFMIVRAWSPRILSREEGIKFRALSVSLFLAFASSASWAVFARGHMRYHFGLNEITLYIPFNLMAFAFIGFAIDKIRSFCYHD